MNDLLVALAAPFPLDLIEFKPGATQEPKDGGELGKALGLAYVDPRHYSARLNDAAGMGWGDSYSLFPVGEKMIVICALTIDGITRTGDGECSLSDANCLTVASAQAFKRSCVKWGLGAGLYDAPQTWAEARFSKAQSGRKPNCRGFTDTGLAQLRRAFTAAPRQTPPPAHTNGATPPGQTVPAADPALETWPEGDAVNQEQGQIQDFLLAIEDAASEPDLKKLHKGLMESSREVRMAVIGTYNTRLKALRATVQRGDPALVN